MYVCMNLYHALLQDPSYGRERISSHRANFSPERLESLFDMKDICRLSEVHILTLESSYAYLYL